MGILFVLVFWAVAGSIAAFVGVLVLRFLTSALTRDAQKDSDKLTRKRLMHFAAWLPPACLVWAGIVFIFQGFVNTTYLHRDLGLGDASYCPLPNGYSLLMIDVSDEGTVYNPKSQLSDDSVADQPDTVSGVRELQVAGVYILGGADSNYFEHFAQDNPSLDRYFILNTQTGHPADFPSEDKLRIAASNLGITLKLEPISKVYDRYRFTWFDFAVLFLLILPPLIAVGLLLRSILRVRSSRAAIQPIGNPGNAS
jgi:hypothetical protein